MPLNVTSELHRLGSLGVTQLKAEYQTVWGEPARSNNRQFLVKRIVWRRQAIEQGDLSERAHARAVELARDADIRVRPGPTTAPMCEPLPPATRASAPAVGSIIRRVYKNREYLLTVEDGGYRIDGVLHKSLSAAARAITNSNWNGPLFFGLAKRGGAS